MIVRLTIIIAMSLFDTYLHWQDAWYGSGASNWFWFDTMRQYDVFWYTYHGIKTLLALSIAIGYFIRVRNLNEMNRRLEL